jgi:tetratricopeptide (TPR) repeat protein
MLDLYYETLDNPLFDGLNLRETDKNLPVGYYTYAVALKSTGGDEQKYVDYLLKALDSDNGALACQDLMTYYKEKGDKANEQKYLAMGVEKFPGQIIFAVNYIQNLIVSKDYTKAVEAADKTIGNIESGVIPATNQNGEKVDANKWPYYFKAVALYNLDKLEDAYNAFVKAYEIEANFHNLSGAANCAANLAQRNNKDKALANKWYDKAIELYEQCRTDYPDKDDVWGIQLYVCYNNKASLNNSQEMLKKAKPFEKYKTK